MPKNKSLPYEWDLYFDVKDTCQLRNEYFRLKQKKQYIEEKLKLIEQMAHEQGLIKYLE